MNAYALLFFAVIAEIIATSALKLSHGFTKLYPSLVVVCGYSTAFWLMGISLKTLPVSILYSLWGGLGILGIALIGVFYFKEPFTIWHFFGTFLIIIGIVILCMVTDIH
jgi:multidrug transporter EmrE-like cation transporter